MRERRRDKSHRGKHEAKKQDSDNSNGNKKEYLIKTGRGSFKVFLDPNLLIKPGRFIKFCGIGGKEKTFVRRDISITKI